MMLFGESITFALLKRNCEGVKVLVWNDESLVFVI